MYMGDQKALGKADNEKTEASRKLLQEGETEAREKTGSHGKVMYRITEAQEKKFRYECRKLRHFAQLVQFLFLELRLKDAQYLVLGTQ